jgi:DNA-binding response OmpR family regulator
MSGVELAQYARERHPKMNIIVMSGRQVTCLPSHATFLHKPFPPVRLLEAVRGSGGAVPTL